MTKKANSKRIQKHRADLHILKRADQPTRESLVEQAPNSLILAICDCACRVLNGESPTTGTDRRLLRPHRDTLRALAHGKDTVAGKRARLQRGSGLKLIPRLLAIGAASAGANAVTSPQELVRRFTSEVKV